MAEVRFDDIDELLRHRSDEPGPWGPQVEVTQATIDRFADLTDDHQYIHVDPEKAKEGPFGTTVAHGLLTIALMASYRPPLDIAIVGEGSRVNYGCESFRFLAPVPAGSALHARARLVDARPHAAGTIVVQELVVHVVGNERPSLIYTGLLLYRP